MIDLRPKNVLPRAIKVFACLALLTNISTLAASADEEMKLEHFNEMVMSPGMQITAVTSGGPVTITAVDGLRRIYTWDGASRSVELYPRQKRWYGSLGAYYPGPGNHWKEHKGVTRGVVEEGQKHFDSKEEAINWLQKKTKKIFPFVYTNDGLTVEYSKNLSRKQLNIDVFQIYINGKKPTELPGSINDDITVSSMSVKEAEKLYKKADQRYPIPLIMQFFLPE